MQKWCKGYFIGNWNFKYVLKITIIKTLYVNNEIIISQFFFPVKRQFFCFEATTCFFQNERKLKWNKSSGVDKKLLPSS